jgi:hypothetical protein
MTSSQPVARIRTGNLEASGQGARGEGRGARGEGRGAQEKRVD